MRDPIPSRPNLIFCIPIFNDWEAASVLLERIAAVAQRNQWSASVLLVDDGSTESPDAMLRVPAGLPTVEILTLRRNLGHQRAIAIGFSFIAANRPCDAIVVMDGDGEDAPEDVEKLWGRATETSLSRIVFAERARRTEGPLFLTFYILYKGVHFLLTGRRVEVGNFSVVPFPLIQRLVGVSELWNHYAASVFKARLPNDQIPIARARRLRSESKMNFVSLVTHGLSAISVYGDEVGVRLIIATIFLMGAAALALVAVVIAAIFAAWAIPGWAVTLAGFLALALLNALILSSLFSFALLQARNATSFLPARDYEYYVLDVRKFGVAAAS